MTPAIETGLLITATIVVGITLVLIPTPRQKPPEFDTPTPQQVVAVIPPPAQTQEDQLDNIEAKILHIQKQVQQMEIKVEGRE